MTMGDDDGDGNESLGISNSLWSHTIRSGCRRHNSIFYLFLSSDTQTGRCDAQGKKTLLILQSTAVHMVQSMRCAVAHILRPFATQ